MTKTGIKKIADRLDATYINQRTFESTEAYIVWLDALKAYDEDDVVNAVQEWIVDNKFPPKPSEIIELIKKAKAALRSEGPKERWLLYLKEDEIGVREYACLIASDAAEATALRKTHSGIPVVLEGRAAYKDMIANTKKLKQRWRSSGKDMAENGHDAEIDGGQNRIQAATC